MVVGTSEAFSEITVLVKAGFRCGFKIAQCRFNQSSSGDAAVLLPQRSLQRAGVNPDPQGGAAVGGKLYR